MEEVYKMELVILAKDKNQLLEDRTKLVGELVI
jgi:hypothetical protein